MTDAVTQIDLYKAMAAAQDDTGRPLFPVLGPNNADGQVSARVGADRHRRRRHAPAGAGAGRVGFRRSRRRSCTTGGRCTARGGALSASTSRRPKLANVYIGLFGYKATAISDFTGVRDIT